MVAPTLFSSCRDAAEVITLSEFSRATIIERYDLRPEKVHAITLAVSDEFRLPQEDSAVQAVKARYALQANTPFTRLTRGHTRTIRRCSRPCTDSKQNIARACRVSLPASSGGDTKLFWDPLKSMAFLPRSTIPGMSRSRTRPCCIEAPASWCSHPCSRGSDFPSLRRWRRIALCSVPMPAASLRSLGMLPFYSIRMILKRWLIRCIEYTLMRNFAARWRKRGESAPFNFPGIGQPARP